MLKELKDIDNSELDYLKQLVQDRLNIMAGGSTDYIDITRVNSLIISVATKLFELKTK